MMTKLQEIQRRLLLSTAHRDFEEGLNKHSFFKLNNRALSIDLVQDTFVKTWSYLVKGGKIEIMKAFLYHVLNNLIIDEYRKRKAISLDLLLEKGVEPLARDASRLFNMIDGRGALALIAQLSEKYQKVMRMKYVQDLTLAEMSTLTSQTKNTIAVQLHRGLEQLKKLYRLPAANY